MAKRMMTRQEIKNHTSPFLSKAWMERKENIVTRVKNKEVQIQYARQQKTNN